MWGLFDDISGLLAIIILLTGAFLGYWLLGKFIGDQAGAIIGLILAAYPAFLAFKKIG